MSPSLPNKLLTFDELRDHGVPLGRKQIARLERLGRFPKRVQISEARIGWLERTASPQDFQTIAEALREDFAKRGGRENDRQP